MNNDFIVPERLKPGDKVAVIAPSSGLAAVFPHVYELGIKRIKEVLSLDPVEFPTTKGKNNSPEARAKDIHEAFADPSIKAIISTIGGNDQIRVIPLLDPELIKSNPKIFCGYSDNTNLHLYLWNLGLVSYYGGSVLVQFAMQGKMHDFTVEYMKKALFEPEIGSIRPSEMFTDYDLEWSDESNLLKERPMMKNNGWDWQQNSNKVVTGRLWGGCVESIAMNLMANRSIPPREKLKGGVLFLETSEELPSSSFVHEFMMSLGERGMLQQFAGVLVGRPKSQYRVQIPHGGQDVYINEQKQAILSAMNIYLPDAPIVFGLNFGHTDPQMMLPSGGIAKIDAGAKTVEFGY